MKTKKMVLAVDDEEDILNLLDFNLKKAGYSTILVNKGSEAIEVARRVTPDLILLDLMLPGINGLDILKILKKEKLTKEIPVIMLTAKDEEIDKILGFELGVDDYITKPFSPRELILRVRAILRRTEEKEHLKIKDHCFKEINIDSARHLITVNGQNIELTGIEFNLLTALIAAEGAVLSRDNLLDKAWGVGCYVLPRTVDVHIKRLRTKLGNRGSYIETVRGVGYRMTMK